MRLQKKYAVPQVRTCARIGGNLLILLLTTAMMVGICLFPAYGEGEKQNDSFSVISNNATSYDNKPSDAIRGTASGVGTAVTDGSIEEDVNDSGGQSDNGGGQSDNGGGQSGDSGDQSDNSGEQSNNSGDQNDNSGEQNDNSGEQNNNSGDQSDNSGGHSGDQSADKNTGAESGGVNTEHVDDVTDGAKESSPPSSTTTESTGGGTNRQSATMVTSTPRPIETPAPTSEPTPEPTAEPTPEPTAEPTPEPEVESKGGGSASPVEQTYILGHELRAFFRDSDTAADPTLTIKGEPIEMTETRDPSSVYVYILIDTTESMEAYSSEVADQISVFVTECLDEGDRFELIPCDDASNARRILDKSQSSSIFAELNNYHWGGTDSVILSKLEELYAEVEGSLGEYGRQYALVFTAGVENPEIPERNASHLLPLYICLYGETDSEVLRLTAQASGGDMLVPSKGDTSALSALKDIRLAIFALPDSLEDATDSLEISIISGGEEKARFSAVVIETPEENPVEEPDEEAAPEKTDEAENEESSGIPAIALVGAAALIGVIVLVAVIVGVSVGKGKKSNAPPVVTGTASRKNAPSGMPVQSGVRASPTATPTSRPQRPVRAPTKSAAAAPKPAAAPRLASDHAQPAPRARARADIGSGIITIQLEISSKDAPSRIYNNRILPGKSITLGRGEACDLKIDDRKLSRSHIKLENRGGLLILRDLESTNGTFLNGTKITGPEALKNNDTILVGLSKIKVVGIW